VGSKEVFKAGSALAVVWAKQGETCGALTGAIMAIGLLVGRERLEDLDQYRKAMGVATRFTISLRNESDIPFAGRS